MSATSAGSGLLYNLPGIGDAIMQIQQAATATDHNHTLSINVLTANASNFGGQGSNAFQHALTLVNQAYNMSQDAIAQAGYALGQASDGMQQTDAQLAAQYMGGGGLY